MVSTTTDDRLLAAVRDLQGRFGDVILDDRRRLTGMLGDLVPEARREIRLIGVAIDDGVPGELRRVPQDQIDLQVQRLAARMEQQHGIRADFARWAVSFWLHVLGRETPMGVEPGSIGTGGTPLVWGDELASPAPAPAAGSSSPPPPWPAKPSAPLIQTAPGIAQRALGWAKIAIVTAAAVVLALLLLGLYLGPDEPDDDGVAPARGGQVQPQQPPRLVPPSRL